MRVELQKLGKRFTREWIFRNLDFTLQSGHKYAILGPNGSGKSTLMQVLSGNLTPSEGNVKHIVNGQETAIEDVYQHISYCAPYIQLIEEFTLQEVLSFHAQFRPFNNLSTADVLSLLELEQHKDKAVLAFSSGMKQRVKLALTMLDGAPLILLDEPATNLDAAGVEWYKRVLAQHCQNATVVVSSNRPEEYDMCEEHLRITDFK